MSPKVYRQDENYVIKLRRLDVSSRWYVEAYNELFGDRTPYRRYHGYDYSRGATLFVTVSTSPRRAIFGRVIEDRVELNQFCLAADETNLRRKSLSLAAILLGVILLCL